MSAVRLQPGASLSASALRRYETCPKQFRLTDLARVRLPQRPSPVLVQANAVHDALDRFYGLPVAHRQAENLEKALRAVWHRNRKPGAFLDSVEEAEYGRAAIEMLRSHGEHGDLEADVLAREQFVSTRIDGFVVFGKIDRVDPGSSGGIELVDYKTGRASLTTETLPRDIAARVYLVAAGDAYAREVECVRILYLSEASEVEWRPACGAPSEVRQQLTALLDTISQDAQFAARPGRHCRFCPHALACPERTRVTLADLEPVDAVVF